jgi:hypothetical protein
VFRDVPEYVIMLHKNLELHRLETASNMVPTAGDYPVLTENYTVEYMEDMKNDILAVADESLFARKDFLLFFRWVRTTK